MGNGNLSATRETIEEGSTTALELEKRNAEVQAKMKKAEEGEVNAFVAVKMMLDTMHDSLDKGNKFGAPPRYVRIAMVGEKELELNKRPVGVAVQAVAGGFLYALGVVAELALKAYDLLVDIDGGKALVEVGAAMLKTLSSKEFTDSLQLAVGIVEPVENPMGKEVGDAVGQFEKVLTYVPGPQDVEDVSKALFKLLAVEHLPEQENEVHVNLSGTGKARLMSWALEKPIPIFTGSGLFDFSSPIKISYLGSRIIENPENPSDNAETAKLNWVSEDEKRTEFIYNCNYPTIKRDKKRDDIVEIKEILDKLGYKKKPTLKENLMDFQVINELKKDGGKEDGILDLHTIHRLMNMDYKKETLKRAAGFDQKKLAS